MMQITLGGIIRSMYTKQQREIFHFNPNPYTAIIAMKNFYSLGEIVHDTRPGRENTPIGLAKYTYSPAFSTG